MIEAVDMGVIATLLGKIGWDEHRRRKNGNGNGPVMARLGKLETKVDALVDTVDRGLAAVRNELKEARDSRGKLFDKYEGCAKAISKVEGRMER
jgi:hypothetical protein